jgi:aryl-alcohol dehydrogenase-like predicted oxidoreductase
MPKSSSCCAGRSPTRAGCPATPHGCAGLAGQRGKPSPGSLGHVHVGGRGVTGTENEDVRAAATADSATAAQVRPAWTLQREPHLLVIPGTGDPAHLAVNVAAGALRLTSEELALLDSVTIPA